MHYYLSMRWLQQANCRGEHTSIFFPVEDERPLERKQRELLAKSICFECVVITDCLNASEGEEGIWGGLTESERRGRSRKLPLLRPVVNRQDPGENPWIAIDTEGAMQIWQRETEKIWHGVEWAVVKNGEIIYISHHLDDTYAKYGSLLHS